MAVTWHSRLVLALAAGVSLLPAYRPAVDTAGPLTVRIEGPEEITQIGAPLPFALVLENAADRAIDGAVKMHGIDRFRVLPGAPVRFSVGAKGRARFEFTVEASQPTYNAWYPIHGLAEFLWQGKRLEAHPILLVNVKAGDPPRPALPPGLKPEVAPPRSSVVSAPPACPPPGTPRSLGTAAGYGVKVWPGQRGLLDAVLAFQKDARTLCFQGFHVQVLGDAVERPDSIHKFLGATEEKAEGRYRIRHRFQSWAGPFDLVTETWNEKNALRTRVAIENAPPRPWVHVHIEDLASGPWSQPARRVYAGPGNVMQDPGAFRLKANGHYMATSYVGLEFPGGISIVQGVDVPADHLGVDPAARSYSMHTPHNQVVSFIPTDDVWNGAKMFRELTAPRPASGVPRLAGRFVFDLWSGNYGDSAMALRRAFRYGLTDALVIWHRWQHWGYDYRLPDIYPPNTTWGTLDEFMDLAGACKKNGVLFAPHDNYMDFYPDSEGFTYDNIAFTAERKPQTAWFNRGAGAQSYHPRSDRVLPFVKRNIKLIKAGFAPGAYFIDVWSSEPPYDYWTAEGQFFDRVYTRDIWREGFAWIREYMDGAPQFSEAGADQYIGWLDGGTAAQMRAENGPQRSNVWQIENSDTERVPWFDIAYHDVFALHGAGYTDRYASGQDPRAHGIYSDDYITTEVMTGHPGMVSEAFGREPVRKYWLLHDLARALTLQRMETFAFANGDMHRHRIRWSNGGEVWVNRGKENWTAAGHELPHYGCYARVPAREGLVEAAIERRDGQIVEWSRSPAMWYVNARPVVFDQQPVRGYSRQQVDWGPDPRPSRMNPENRVVNFGAVKTNGGFRLARAGGAVELTPLPLSPAFTVRIRWRELPWKTAEPTQAEALREDGSVLRRIPVANNRGEFELNCEPDVFSYRLR
jgi:hypothetical protein